MRKIFGEIYDVYSVGSESSTINPLTIKVLQEIGIDASKQYSKHFDDLKEKEFDYVVALCSSQNQTGPFVPGAKKYIHQTFDDPSLFKGSEDQAVSKFRLKRDEIKIWIKNTFK